jgi:DNA mismatch endonuclease (patch repair protein)
MDKPAPERRSENMRRIRSKGMKPELALRRLVHGMGYRYRLHCADLPGHPDLVFRRAKKVIFAHGCFWHSHAKSTCKAAHIPKSNVSYWIPKLKRNHIRDARNNSRLRRMGWGVLVIWECNLNDRRKVAARIKNFLARTQ